MCCNNLCKQQIICVSFGDKETKRLSWIGQRVRGRHLSSRQTYRLVGADNRNQSRALEAISLSGCSSLNSRCLDEWRHQSGGEPYREGSDALVYDQFDLLCRQISLINSNFLIYSHSRATYHPHHHPRLRQPPWPSHLQQFRLARAAPHRARPHPMDHRIRDAVIRADRYSPIPSPVRRCVHVSTINR